MCVYLYFSFMQVHAMLSHSRNDDQESEYEYNDETDVEVGGM